ncbi:MULTISPECIES: hypothetical protein [Clostridium]|uniref:hypothetical protein n=1 Tax=Clostridium TaxID=1485 RepID=UPI0015D4E0F9|nr:MULTISPECIES: hypothetical protein [Clostridium]MDU1279189.1 hypothetical protein [Clostridium sp.]MDU7085901.1 hypothetical protein [Clostridium sp.]
MYVNVKDLKTFLSECDDNSTIIFEYNGCDTEIENGDAFSNINLENSDIYDKSVRISFK